MTKPNMLDGDKMMLEARIEALERDNKRLSNVVMAGKEWIKNPSSKNWDDLERVYSRIKGSATGKDGE